MSITLEVTEYYENGQHWETCNSVYALGEAAKRCWSLAVTQAQEHHDAGQPYVTGANEEELRALYSVGWGISPKSAQGLSMVELEAMLLQDVSGAANEIAEGWTDGDGLIDWAGYSESVGTLSADPAGNIYIHFSA